MGDVRESGLPLPKEGAGLTPFLTRTGMTLYHGNCLEVLPSLPDASVDAVVTDPPYALSNIEGGMKLTKNGDGTSRTDQRRYKQMQAKGFMGQTWDTGDVAFGTEVWEEALRLTKPGGYLLAFGGTRTYHRLACAIEDAGWQIVDSIHWCYSTGFPKAKSQLKPSHEMICLARKKSIPVMPLQIDAARIKSVGEHLRAPQSVPDNRRGMARKFGYGKDDVERNQRAQRESIERTNTLGRWPPNTILVHQESCRLVGTVRVRADGGTKKNEVQGTIYGGGDGLPNHERANYAEEDGKEEVESWVCDDDCPVGQVEREGGIGTSRFFPTFTYRSKASRADRGDENTHTTVKSIALMRWLISLVTPPGGMVLDPFAGSGSTLIAAQALGMQSIGIELLEEHCAIIERRTAKDYLDFDSSE